MANRDGTPRQVISCFRLLLAHCPGEAVLSMGGRTARVEALTGKKPVLQTGLEINCLLTLAGQAVCLSYR